MSALDILLNHRVGRDNLIDFLSDRDSLCLVRAPKSYGKSQLSTWLFEHCQDLQIPVLHLQFNNNMDPRGIILRIIRSLAINTAACTCFNNVPKPFDSLRANISNIDIKGSNTTITANAGYIDPRILNIYNSDLFVAFRSDLLSSGIDHRLILIIDNFDSGDEATRQWTCSDLVTLVTDLRNIKIVLFCRDFDLRDLDYEIRRISRSFQLEAITKSEMHEFFEEQGISIDKTVARVIDNSFSQFSSYPDLLACCLRALCHEPK